MFWVTEIDTAASRLVLDAPIALDAREPQGLRAAFLSGVSKNGSGQSPLRPLKDELKSKKGSSVALVIKGLGGVAEVSRFISYSSRPFRGQSLAV